MVRLLKRFVHCESPTDSKVAVDNFGRVVAAEWRRRGAKVERLFRKNAGNHLRITWPANSARQAKNPAREGQILVLGHMDTVYETGTIKKMPFRVIRGRAFGPGTFDMKGGLVIALFAVDALIRADWLPHRRIVFLWTSDEETGSKSSREIIENEAPRSGAVLVLEPAGRPAAPHKTPPKTRGTPGPVFSRHAAQAHAAPPEP